MSTALVPVPPAVIERFQRNGRLTVRQRKRWLELLFSFEMKNAYDVFDADQTPVFRVEERGQGFLSFMKRAFFGPMRWFTSDVKDLAAQATLLTIERPFRFYFHTIQVTGPNGEPLGSITREWSWLRRIYTARDAQGQPVATLFGPFFRPWTFEIRLHGSEQPSGAIQKRWSGMLKEVFTDADNFGIDLEAVADPALRALLFAATVLIDVVHFERAKR